MRHAFLILLLLIPRPVWALCVGTVLQAVPPTSTFQGSGGEYNVYDPAEYTQTVNFQVATFAGVGGCKYFVTLDTGSSGNAAQRTLVNGTTLNYNAHRPDGNVLNASGAYNGANVISGSFGFILSVLQTANHSLNWKITPQQVVEAKGTRYEDSHVTLRVWAELALGIYTNSSSMPITFRTRAESSVDLSLVSTGGAFNVSDTAQTIDFGDLTSGEILSYDTVIRSNDGYAVTLESQNGQVMNHENHPGVADAVPYTVTFDGAPVDLSSGNPVQVTSGTALSPVTGTRFATQFTVGTLGGHEAAGNYNDVITVTLSAN